VELSKYIQRMEIFIDNLYRFLVLIKFALEREGKNADALRIAAVTPQ